MATSRPASPFALPRALRAQAEASLHKGTGHSTGTHATLTRARPSRVRASASRFPRCRWAAFSLSDCIPEFRLWTTRSAAKFPSPNGVPSGIRKRPRHTRQTPSTVARTTGTRRRKATFRDDRYRLCRRAAMRLRQRARAHSPERPGRPVRGSGPARQGRATAGRCRKRGVLDRRTRQAQLPALASE
jgi:hypothetical protein